jgi:hypothetical protein
MTPFWFWDLLHFQGILYEADSPDEATLVEAAKNLGFVLSVCPINLELPKTYDWYRNVFIIRTLKLILMENLL